MELSNFHKARYEYKAKLPAILAGGLEELAVEMGGATEALSDHEEIKAVFKHSYGQPVARFVKGKSEKNRRLLNVGVILSGGQAPGGHNVIAGLFDGLKKGNPASKLYGFLGGPSGLTDGKYIEIDAELVDKYRNTGGFDMIGSGRTKIETPEQFSASLDTAQKLKLNALVIIGGDDSNTNAGLLAEYFLDKGAGIQVIGCPKTIDGDLKHEHIEASFGFDTAAKTYSELIGNIARDADSAKKYWHFVKLMGRAASHIALEAALQTRPNLCFISEEIEAKRVSLAQIVDKICASVLKRSENNENFGIILIPEGLVEFIPEVKALISELNDIMAQHKSEFDKAKTFSEQSAWLMTKLSPASAALFNELPEEIAKQLLIDRDPHGNVQVSRIDTEKLLMRLTEKQIAGLKTAGKFNGSFSTHGHFFGYEGRAAFPSNFDADYCYTLGFSAFALIAAGLTGYVSSVRHLAAPASEWDAGGVPITMLMNMERRKGKNKPVIKKALVDLDGAPFKAFAAMRDELALKTCFRYPGAIQYYGPQEVCGQTTITLKLEHEGIK
ncbi:MAG: diphosphate--fructose-6-phosphate 1-phosphotransferase [Spirochaetaceae bacterium]|jgi:pyrophosphate--fructose-6-phosphate 1-phosphotransferase|nr:diphosphate--fructose-6-phosphate 1-phosphotransferase [Spirochaetaceae bacterium]